MGKPRPEEETGDDIVPRTSSSSRDCVEERSIEGQEDSQKDKIH